jgi:hypothetical protein
MTIAFVSADLRYFSHNSRPRRCPGPGKYAVQDAEHDRTGRDSARPHTNKTDADAPAAEMIMHVVTWSLSVIEPIVTRPVVAEILIGMSVNADVKVEVPKVSWA